MHARSIKAALCAIIIVGKVGLAMGEDVGDHGGDETWCNNMREKYD